MTMHLEASFGQHMELRVSPTLIQFTEILQMSGLELQQRIEAMVLENPALELNEAETCPSCGDVLLADGSCLRCHHGDDAVRRAELALSEPEDDDFDPWATVADQESLHEHLLAEVLAVVGEEDRPIAEMLVGELDERGFLGMPVDMVAASLEVDEDRVLRVLKVLQSVGPLGVGARSVQECLLLQLDRWQEQGMADPLARLLVTTHLDDLAQGKYSALARELKVTHEDVLQARDFIRHHLRPYPVFERTDMAPWERQSGPGTLIPDVVMRLTDKDEVVVDVVESRRYALSISPMYRALAAELDPRLLEARRRPGIRRLSVDGRAMDAPSSAPHLPVNTLSSDEREHIVQQVTQAGQFVQHIRDRRATLLAVAEYVASRQFAFLKFGPRYLQPLTRAEVANVLGVHESTVSRATADKYVLLPSRQVVPFGTFFKAALSVHDVIRELVSGESHPLTDGELAELLAERGFDVARRTVAKYREQMGILPSSLR